MLIPEPKVKKILFITLSNVGDVILTLPVLDYLKAAFIQSKITVMVGPRPKEIFEDNPNIDRLIIYDKYAKLREKVKLFWELKKKNFDVVVDLRNTFYGAMLPARFRTSPFLFIPKDIRHIKERNLYRLKEALKSKERFSELKERTFYFTVKDKDYIDSLLKKRGITESDNIILVSPSAGGKTRRWESQNFTQLCNSLSQDYKVILIGAAVHQPTSQYILQNCSNQIFDFTGLTNLKALAYLLNRAKLLITCDTGTLQLASYLDTPIVALFGPSDEQRYGPWSSKSRIVKKEIFCRPCRVAHCRFQTLDCMRLIRVEDVLQAVKDINYK